MKTVEIFWKEATMEQTIVNIEAFCNKEVKENKKS